MADSTGRRRMERRIAELDGHVIVAGLGRVGPAGGHGAGRGRARRSWRSIPGPAADAIRRGARLSPTWRATPRRTRSWSGPAFAGPGASSPPLPTTPRTCTSCFRRAFSTRRCASSRARPTRPAFPSSCGPGADRAISPYAIGGHRLAHLILSPAVVDFFETALKRGHEALAIEDVALPSGSGAIGRTLEALSVRQATGASVLACSARARRSRTLRRTSRSQPATACSRWGRAISWSGSRS